MGLTVNIDTATAAFLPSWNVLDFLIEVAGFRSPNEVRQLDNRARAAMKKAIKNVKVCGQSFSAFLSRFVAQFWPSIPSMCPTASG